MGHLVSKLAVVPLTGPTMPLTVLSALPTRFTNATPTVLFAKSKAERFSVKDLAVRDVETGKARFQLNRCAVAGEARPARVLLDVNGAPIAYLRSKSKSKGKAEHAPPHRFIVTSSVDGKTELFEMIPRKRHWGMTLKLQCRDANTDQSMSIEAWQDPRSKSAVVMLDIADSRRSGVIARFRRRDRDEDPVHSVSKTGGFELEIAAGVDQALIALIFLALDELQ